MVARTQQHALSPIIMSEVRVGPVVHGQKVPDERKRAGVFIIGSFVFHCLVLAIGSLTYNPKIPLFEDSGISVDLVAEINLQSAKDTALPQAQQSPLEAVPSNILPQLPKSFEIEEQKNSEREVFAEERNNKDKAPKNDTVEKEQEPSKKAREDVNKLTKEDALKRLALEKLRLDEKTAKDLRSPKVDALARIKDELASGTRTAGAQGSGQSNSRYASQLQGAIRRNWSLPETFKLDKANLRTEIEIALDKRGELVRLKIIKSSGNPAFDESAVRAIRASTPLPPPNDDLAGQPIRLPFTL